MFRMYLPLVSAGFLLAACVSTPAPIRDATSGTYDEPVYVELPADQRPSALPPQGSFVPDETFSICRLRVRNAPASDEDRRVIGYGQLFVLDQSIALATVPLNGACLSSGFGQRNGRPHKGIDLSAPRGTWVYSAAPGIVRELGWGGRFGNYMLIEHGYGVFTRYAHMDTFVEGIDVGSELGFGWPIGQVGNSSTDQIGVHLHYEVLQGDNSTAKKSFALTATDPFSHPIYSPVPAS